MRLKQAFVLALLAWLMANPFRIAPSVIPGARAAEQLQPIVSIASGGRVFIRADGSVWSFIDMSELTRPTQVMGLNEIVRVGIEGPIGGDGWKGYALKKDGTVWVWTINCQSFEDGSNTCQHGRAERTPGIDAASDLSIGKGFVIVLKRDGTLWGWGDNTIGELGNTPNQLNLTLGAIDQLRKDSVKTVRDAVQIPINAEIVSVSATFDHAMAIDRTGHAWAWGLFSHDPRDRGEGEFIGENGIGAVKLMQSPLADKILVYGSRSYVVAKDGTLWGAGVYREGVLRFGDFAFTQIAGVDNPRVITAYRGAVLWIDQDGKGWQSGPGVFPYDRDHPEKREAIPIDTEIRDVSVDDFVVSVLTEDGRIVTWFNEFNSRSKPIVVMDH